MTKKRLLHIKKARIDDPGLFICIDEPYFTGSFVVSFLTAGPFLSNN